MTVEKVYITYEIPISTHTPLAGRDPFAFDPALLMMISTHTPLAGRDRKKEPIVSGRIDFYSHAPRGA